MNRSPSTPSDQLIELLTRRLRVIAEPTRVRILLVLEQGEATVQELCDELGLSHQSGSKHLGLLHNAGVLSRRREGNKAFYSLVDYSACRLIEQARRSTTGYIEELVGIAGLETSE